MLHYVFQDKVSYYSLRPRKREGWEEASDRVLETFAAKSSRKRLLCLTANMGLASGAFIAEQTSEIPTGFVGI